MFILKIKNNLLQLNYEPHTGNTFNTLHNIPKTGKLLHIPMGVYKNLIQQLKNNISQILKQRIIYCS